MSIMETSVKDFLNSAFSRDSREMLCSICNRYLSIPPIFYNNLLGNICGRCESSVEVTETKKLKNENCFMERQKVFEFVAKFLVFPCTFNVNGCEEKLNWGEVDVHERNCSYRTTECFLNNKKFLEENQNICDWIGEPVDIASHFVDNHSSCFTNGSSLRTVLGIEGSSVLGPLFGMDGITYEPKFKSKIHCVEAFGHVSIIILHYHKRSNIYSCQIFTDLSHYKSKLFEYQLEIFDDNKKHSLIFPKTEVQSLKDYFQHTATDEESLEIDLNYISKLLKMPHFFTVDFRILKKNMVAVSSLRNILYNDHCYDKNFLEHMKCSACSAYLSPAIFSCINGHNICEICRGEEEDEDGDLCVVCQAVWCNFRNVAMEKLSYLLNFPCANRDSGCNYIAPMPLISNHETICNKIPRGKSRKCFFEKCDWQGTNFLAHMKEKHSFFETNKLYHLQPGDHNGFFVYDDHIFVNQMGFTVESELRYFIVCCGTHDLKYRYELQLVDGFTDKKMHSVITLSQLCEPEYSYDSEYTEVLVPFSLLYNLFLNHTKIKFQINIFPVD